MTPQEESMLNDLVGRVEQTQLTEKDPEAERLLEQRLGPNPNALYILAQTVLVQKYALEQAQAQINQLRQQAPPPPARATSFLGNLLGHHDPAPPPPLPPPPAPGYGAPPNAQPYGQAWSPVPAYGAPPPPGFGGGPSFLRTAATTAAGVAAGALAFQGVESLLHGFGQPAGFGGGSGFLGGDRPEEIITNNYYDDAGRGSGEGHRAGSSDYGDSGNDAANLQQASDGLRDDGSNLDDGSYDDSSLDDLSVDDSSYDDSSSGDDLV
jgi:uncharacterized protein